MEMKDIYRCKICGKYVEEPYHCNSGAEFIMSRKQRELLSKLMSYLLRHAPNEAGLELDNNGWTRVEDLVNGIRTIWRSKYLYSWVRKEHIYAIALLDPKGRFEVKGNMIRARYGHSKSVPIAITYPEDKYIELLYHGTSSDSLDNIFKEGIKPMKRHYVHLSTSFEDACKVGRRHSLNSVVLVVDANCIREHGIKVLFATQSVRLVNYVLASCIRGVRSC